MHGYQDKISSQVASIGSSDNGNTAMMFALLVIPLLMVAGFSVDYSRQVSAERHLQDAIDAASLAGARSLEDASQSDLQIIATARASFQENLNSAHDDLNCGNAAIAVDRVAGRVQVDATCVMPTMLGGPIWKEDVSVKGVSIAQASVSKLDIALMLDVSGSMSGQKLTDLKAAAKEAAATLITPATGDRVRISFNTYSTAVNAGVFAPDVLQNGGNPGISDCVSEREGVSAWTEDAPGPGEWLGDDATACPASSVLPLTNDLAVFNTEIDALKAGGYTAGHLGVAWAWYLISPEWDAIWPAASEPLPYTEPHGKKAVILMTDGKFNTQYASGMGNSNVQAKKMCKQMRDQGVLVYAVAFQAPSSAKVTLKDCAGDEDRFFEASSGAELKAAYAAIASQLSNLALVG